LLSRSRGITAHTIPIITVTAVTDLVLITVPAVFPRYFIVPVQNTSYKFMIHISNTTVENTTEVILLSANNHYEFLHEMWNRETSYYL